MNPISSDSREALEITSQRAELAAIIEQYCSTDGTHPTPIPGLTFFRHASPSTAACAVVKSLFALLVQGTKRVVLADEVYEYDQRHYLITSVDLPLLAQITEASPEAPYLGLALELDARQIGELMSKMPPFCRRPQQSRVAWRSAKSRLRFSVPPSASPACSPRPRPFRYWHR